MKSYSSNRKHIGHFKSPGLKLLSALLLTFILLQGCKKEGMLSQASESLPMQPALSIGNVSYNSQHDILVFSTIQDVRDLEEDLLDLNANYPFNQGNTASIQATMQNIQNYGYYQGSQGNGNQVNLDNFETLLLASYPISNDLLIGLMDLNNNLSTGLPSQFLSNVFTANVPYTYEVEEAVTNATMQNAAKQAILTADDQTMLVPNLAFNDFLSQFPNFNSLYEVTELQDKTDLENGISPSSQQFDQEFVREGIMRLILNGQHEVYIEGHLYKLYTDCQWAIFLGSLTEAYSEVSMLDGNGYDVPPTTVQETNAGIPLATMENNFPMNYTMIDPGTYDPITNSFEDHQQEISPNCPEAFFTAHFDPTTWLKYDFTRHDPMGYPGTDYHHYWTFGDGTGSFADNPSHIYAVAGTYVVRLTVFKEDCGCWDTFAWRVVTGTNNGDRGVCISSFNWAYGSPTNTIHFDVNFTWDEFGAPIDNIAWDFGDGVTSTGTTDLFATHTYATNDVYTVTLTVTFESECEAVYENEVDINNFATCCDLFDSFLNPTLDVFGDGSAILLIEDYARGYHATWGAKIKGKQTFYRKNWNDKWRQRKANHLVLLTGSAKEINYDLECIGPAIPVPSGTEAEDPNGRSCKLSIGDAFIGGLNGMGMQSNSLIFQHRVSFGPQVLMGYFVPLGDC